MRAAHQMVEKNGFTHYVHLDDFTASFIIYNARAIFFLFISEFSLSRRRQTQDKESFPVTRQVLHHSWSEQFFFSWNINILCTGHEKQVISISIRKNAVYNVRAQLCKILLSLFD